MDIDLEHAYAAYEARFRKRFGEKPPGTFVKFGSTMVQRLGPADFPPRLEAYLQIHKLCKEMLDGQSTINDDVILEFQERSAWIAIDAPNLLDMFRGEMGDPAIATGGTRIDAGATTEDHDTVKE